jgi:hypothetical protein
MKRNADARKVKVIVACLPTGTGEQGRECIEYRILEGDETKRTGRFLVRREVLMRETRLVAASAERVLSGNAPEARKEFEDRIATLGAQLLPELGLAGLVGGGTHPQLDATQSELQGVPWEAMTELYAFCDNPRCPEFQKPASPRMGAPFPAGSCTCEQAGQPRPRRLRRGRIGCTRCTSYAVTRPKDADPAGSAADTFLMVIDPDGTLCDVNTPAGKACEAHVSEICRQLARRGYRALPLSGDMATVDEVKHALRNPCLAGAYFFGHGELQDNEGCLRLKDGRLFASEIVNLSPTPRFVLINACLSGNSGNDDELSTQIRSMAEAFAFNSRGKVVIAPIWRVHSVHAARMATQILGRAFHGATLDGALRAARRGSYLRYQQGEPDLGWASYRLFGDPGRRLPPSPGAAAPGAQQQTCRVFKRQGSRTGEQFHSDLFAFDIEDVLLRAVKRQILQDRRRVTVHDLVAGLLRRGELTRLAVQQFGRDPDAAYTALRDVAESEGADPGAPAKPLLEKLDPDSLRQQLLPDTRGSFAAPAAQVLCTADAKAQQRGGASAAISELDLLTAILDAEGWPTQSEIALPPAKKLGGYVQSTERSKAVDDNGQIHLADLDPAARKVIDRALALAQQRGARPIPNRLLLAAFLMDENGYAAQWCREHHVKGDLLCALLIAGTPGGDPISFGLGLSVCKRSILPMLERARAAKVKPITEEALFKAYCDDAPPGLMALLKEPPSGDLGGGLDTARLSREICELLARAAGWARVQGGSVIHRTHLFVAMIGDGQGAVGQLLHQAILPVQTVQIAILGLMRPQVVQNRHDPRVGLSATCAAILREAIRVADQREAGSQATLDDILKAFFATENGGPVGAALRKLGITEFPGARPEDNGKTTAGY